MAGHKIIGKLALMTKTIVSEVEIGCFFSFEKIKDISKLRVCLITEEN